MSRFRHGMSGTKVHNTWLGMIDRCRNDRSGNYGARGISVCERWETFENFLDDMGEPPPGTSIDRIDNDGDYEPGNCRWATRVQQARNTRANTVLEWRGESRTIAEWSEVTGIKPATICHRLANGWPTGRALSRPVLPSYGDVKPWESAGMSRSGWYRAQKAGAP